jgi:hypothetical protein
VSGRVIDGLTNAPLPGIAVTINSSAPRGKLSESIQTTTDRDGRFRGVALPGHAGLQIYSNGSEEAGNYMPPPPVGQPTIVIGQDDKEKAFPEFRLTAARRIIGRLTGKSRTGHGMQVAVDDLPQRGRCDADGYFLLMLPLDHRPKKYIFGDWLGGHKPEAQVISTSPLVLEMPENFTF